MKNLKINISLRERKKNKREREKEKVGSLISVLIHEYINNLTSYLFELQIKFIDEEEKDETMYNNDKCTERERE